MKHDIKCDMNCFECDKPDCRRNCTLTPEETRAIATWLPQEANSQKRGRKNAKD